MVNIAAETRAHLARRAQQWRQRETEREGTPPAAKPRMPALATVTALAVVTDADNTGNADRDPPSYERPGLASRAVRAKPISSSEAGSWPTLSAVSAGLIRSERPASLR